MSNSKMSKHCPAKGCKAMIPHNKIMCERCWLGKVPRELKHMLGHVRKNGPLAVEGGKKLDEHAVIKLTVDAARGKPAPYAAAQPPTIDQSNPTALGLTGVLTAPPINSKPYTEAPGGTP